MVFIYVILCLAAIICVIFCIKLVQLIAGNKKVAKELTGLKFKKLSLDTVKQLSILPLVEFYADDPSLKTEAGVSYFIQADDTKILMDLGEKEYLNYRPKCVFVTHLHPDHAIFLRESIKKAEDFLFLKDLING